LTESLITSGYYDAVVGLNAEGSDTTLTVDKGKPYYIDDLVLLGVPDSIAAAVLSIKERDDLLSVETVADVMNDIVRHYAENGYPFAEVRIQRRLVVDGRLYLECLLISGPRVDVGSIQFSGLKTTLPQTLTARLKLHSGESYKERDLDESTAALERLRFSRLLREPTVLFNSRSEQADIQFLMEDTRNLSVGGGLFLLPDNTLAGNLDLGVLNLLGGGRELRLLWSKKDRQSQQLQFDLRLPYFSGLPLDIRWSLRQEDQDSAFISTGTRASVEYLVDTRWSVGAEIGWAKVTPEENRLSPSARVLSVALLSAYDHRDQAVQTISGELLDYRLSSSYRREFGRDDGVRTGYSTELAADLRFWRPLARSLVGYCRLQAFQTKSDFEPIPPDQLVPIGGPETTRGYREKSFLAQVGVLTTIELQWHALDRLLLRVFTDNSYIRAVEEDRALTGFGFGMSVATTAGTARFDLSLGEEKTLSRLLVHFGFESEL
jgi:outer membrane protein assembly factor BamA